MAAAPRGPAGFRASIGLYARLLPYVRAEWLLLLATAAAMLGTTLVTLARPWPLQVIVDSVLGSRPAPGWVRVTLGDLEPRALLIASIALMVAALVAGQLLALAQEYCAQLLGQRMVLTLRCELYAKLQRLSLRFHDHSNVGDLLYRITGDAAALQNIVTYGFVALAVQSVTAVAIAATIFLLDVRLGFAAVAIVPALVLSLVWFSGRVRARTRGLATAESSLYTTVSEVLGSMRAVKSFAMEDLEIERFESRARSSKEEYVRVMTLSKLGALVTETLGGLGTAAVVFVGALATLRHELTVGELLVFVAYLQALYGPVTYLAASALVVQRSGVSLERVFAVLDQEDERSTGGSLRPRAVSGRIAYQNVSFSHDHSRLAVRNASFEVAAGERVAFVGRSGAGKTTLLSLLLRFYPPLEGHVLLDGTDLATLDLGWLRRQIALVLQEPILFSSSLGENIAYGRPGATRREILAASRAAGFHDYVASLPDGYDTRVGERGVRLSGGQRQLLSIARAFLKDAPILILDEPTSQLDTTTEQHVFRSLGQLAAGRTTLIIAHRLATAQRADRIIVVQDGRVAEQGTHAALVAAGGAYAGLCRDQLLEPSSG